MIERVLVPMDDSDTAEAALRYALEVHPDAEITIFNVVGSPSPMMGERTAMALEDDLEAAVREEAEAVFDRSRAVADEYDAEVTTRVVVGSPAESIVDAAEEYDAVVIGAHSSSLVHRLVVGNVAETVVRESPVPVTTVR